MRDFVKVSLAFLAVAALLFVCGTLARGDDFSDRIAALEAKTAKKADPFSPKNAKDCGCFQGSRCVCGTTCDCTPAKVTASDPLIQASDGRYYRRSEWGPMGPQFQSATEGQPTGWYVGGTYYSTSATAAGGCSSGGCGSSSGSGRFRRR